MATPEYSNFIQDFITEDTESGRYGGRVHTRFPPEPNGYLHIGHAKAICLDFGIAAANGGLCNLRFDDTNPAAEDVEYVDAIQADIKWLGFSWDDRMFYASAYFDKLYEWAVKLIRDGKAYVDDLSPDQVREYRGTLTEPGKESPYRNRSVAENLDLFERMKAGEFPNGARTLRAKIDMASGNINMRDPVIYRILHAHHHQTGDQWCLYPTYDYAHPLSDAIEGITHSLCTLEFEDHRPLYNWLLEACEIPQAPRQIEFARLNLTHTITSKRNLRRLVEENIVSGWDDPRMPTIAGIRRRGYTPASIRRFCDDVGISKTNSVVSLAQLEYFVREDLNRTASRVMAVLRPLKVVLTNYPEDLVEEFMVENNPEDPNAGSRSVPFSRTIYIEQEDFMEEPAPKYFRLAPGREVRLKGTYFIKCQDVVKDADGNIVELHCTYDPETRGGEAPDGRKVKSTIHWVSAAHAQDATVRLYDTLFLTPNPAEGGDVMANLNPNSLEVLEGCKVEPSVHGADTGSRYQFLRHGYFCVDPDSTEDRMVFNRTITLKDTWAKVSSK
ncbi:MAG TPA: glutamine--tRNA ligase/YqeY domain fusion protein [Symbiobacteriaceae bacterium]|nr:glutamine--tRNA ligase/YqeY domain fusion protein [Symbiobacteriaceae bacterium]